MIDEPLLIGLAKATWTVTGALGILLLFILITGGMLWLWLQIGKWLTKYIQKAKADFAEVLQGYRGVTKAKPKKSNKVISCKENMAHVRLRRSRKGEIEAGQPAEPTS